MLGRVRQRSGDPNPQYVSKSTAVEMGGRTAVQMGVVLRGFPSVEAWKPGKHGNANVQIEGCTADIFSDTFDHDKGQKSAISGRRLHWIFFEFSPVDFLRFSPGSLCNLVFGNGRKTWRILPDFRAEKNLGAVT